MESVVLFSSSFIRPKPMILAVLLPPCSLHSPHFFTEA
ncbi:ferredoxin [Escherichia coli]